MAHLITTTAQVKEYVNVGNGLSIDTIRPALNEVEMQELTYFLGADLLAEIVAQVNSVPQVFTPRIQKIHAYAMAACVGLAIYKAGPEIEVLVSDSGILRTETNTEKAAWGGQVKRFRDTAADRGFKAIDAMLLIIETYEQDYPEWLESQYYALKNGLLIRSAADFEAAGESINGSALTFQSLRPILLGIQETTIARKLPEELYQEIIDGLASGNLSEELLLILNKFIRPALAKFTIEEAMTTLPVVVSHSGVSVNQVELAGDSRTSKHADMALIEKKAWSLRGSGQQHINMMIDYLNTKATSVIYPLWFTSDFYSKTLKAQILEESISPLERKIYRA